MTRVALLFSGFAILLAWLNPNHFSPWAAFYEEYLAFFSLMLLWIAYLGREKKFSFLLLGIGATILLIICQYFTDVIYFAGDAWMAIFYLLGCGAAYQIGLSSEREHLTTQLAMVLLCGGLITALIGICQWLEFGSSWMAAPALGQSGGNLSQPNNYATLLIWSVCALSYLYLQCALTPWAFSLLALLLAFGLAVSLSRTPVLQSIFWMVLFCWAIKSGVLNRQKAGATLPIVLFLLTYLVFPTLDSFLFVKDSGELGFVVKTYSKRLSIWGSLLKPIWESPLLGYGVGQVSVAQFTFLNDFARPVEFVEHGHNVLLDILIWFGPVAGGLLIAFLIYWIGRKIWTITSTTDWYLLACIGTLLIHALLEYPIEYAYFLLPFSLMLGLSDAGKVRTLNIFAFRQLYGVFLLLPALVIMTWVWREYRILEEDHRLMRAQNFRLAVDPNLRLSEGVILIDGERDYIRFARQRAGRDMSAEELAWMKKVTYRYPFAVIIYRYSVALALNGDATGADAEIKKILHYYGPDFYKYYRSYFDKSVAAGQEI